MEGRECSMSGETDFGKADESKFESYPLHWGCLFAGKWWIFTATYFVTLK